MSKKKHHYVPKLYLRAFSSAPKRIHLYNLNTGKSVENASLKHQCYRDKFYGPTNEMENNLGLLEGKIAPVLRKIARSKALPVPGTDERDVLLAFVTLQLLRTTVAANRIDVSTDKVMKQAYSGDPRSGDLEQVRFGFEDAVQVSVGNLGLLMSAMSDLGMRLILSPTDGFITSDNPAFKYNQYCEGVDYKGVLGGLCRGLQSFVPLSPHVHLVLYDSNVYKVTNRLRSYSIASKADVDSLNLIQLVAADENVYFSKSEQTEYVRRLFPKAMGYRTMDPVRVVEYGRDNNANSSLLHQFERMPNLKLSLSFLKLKRRARRVPLADRAQSYRKEFVLPDLPLPPGLEEGGRVTFSRFIGKR